MGVGASYEFPISEKKLLDFGFGVGGGVDETESYVWDFESSIAIYVKGEIRQYYNLSKREEKGKRTLNNSGNYFGLQVKYFSQRISEGSEFPVPLNNSILTQLHWGLQRSLGGNWLFNLHLGFGVLRNLDNKNGLLSPALGLKFSYKLF